MKNVSKRILVIDDDIDLLMLLERCLLKEGYDVETAASLSEAEEILDAFNPGLILLDINVKGEDGRKLCWKIKKSPHSKNTVIIVVSGYDYSAARAVLFGADELLPKPFHLEYLLHRLKLHFTAKAEMEEDGIFRSYLK